jgi:hypothetical protein
MILKLTFGIWLAAAGADNVTTYRGISQPPVTLNGVTYSIREGNPFLSPMQDKPALMLGVASAVDAGSAALWLHVGKTHKWVAVSALIGQAAFRGYLVSRGLDHLHAQQARIQQAATPTFTRTFP